MHRPVGGDRPRTRIRLTYSCRVGVQVRRTRGRCGGTRTGRRGSAPTPCEPSTNASASIHARPASEHHEQQPPPRQPLGERRRRAARQHREDARPAPCPGRPAGPSRRAAAGSECTWTSQPVTAGTAIASTISATATASPHAAGRRPSRGRARRRSCREPRDAAGRAVPRCGRKGFVRVLRAVTRGPRPSVAHARRLRPGAAVPGRGTGAARPAADASPTPSRVIVVDNGSTDDTAEVARALGATVVARGPARVRRRRARRRRGGDGRLRRGDGRRRVLRPRRPACRCSTRSAPGGADLAAGRRRPVAPRRLAVARARRQRAVLWWLRRRIGLPVHDIAPMRVCRREALLALDVRDRRFGYPVELLQRAAAGGLADHASTTSPTTRAPRAPAPRCPARCAAPCAPPATSPGCCREARRCW